MIDDIKRRLRAYLHRHDAIVLTYHSILPDPLPFPLWHNLTAHKFDEHISMLSRNFRCVPVSELLQDLALKRIKPYTVAVTFDDGFRNNLTHALPVLARYQVPATLFITSGFIGGHCLLWPEWVACIVAHTQVPAIPFAGQNFPVLSVADRITAFRALARVFKQFQPVELSARIDELARAAGVTRQTIEQGPMCHAFASLTWEEVGRLRDSGLFEFGAHTVNHWRLTNLDAEQARHQIFESKRQIEAQLGQVTHFAYPHGGPDDFNESHREMAIEAGFQSIFTAVSGTITTRSDRFALSRFGIGGEIARDQFSYMLHGGVARVNEAQLT